MAKGKIAMISVTRASVLLAALLATACAAESSSEEPNSEEGAVGTTAAALSGALDSTFDGNGMRLSAYPGASDYDPPYSPLWSYPTAAPTQAVAMGGVETASGQLL